VEMKAALVATDCDGDHTPRPTPKAYNRAAFAGETLGSNTGLCTCGPRWGSPRFPVDQEIPGVPRRFIGGSMKVVII
jgi:hypothetical protein